MKCFYETLNHILDLSACKESSQHKLISNRNLAMTSMTISRISTVPPHFTLHILLSAKCPLPMYLKSIMFFLN